MLAEIKSTAFKTKDAIVLGSGLNIVLGQENKANSVGKSTFLLAIDFAFGGNSYVDSKNKIITLFGNHTVCFAHKFSDKTYYFCRSTAEPTFVTKCDEKYAPSSEKIKVSDFTKFLKEKYNLGEYDITFREMISPFARIAGRFETDVENPLKSAGDTSQSKSIERFEKLFSDYEKLKSKSKEKILAESKATVFSNAVKYGFVTSPINSEKTAQEIKSELEAAKKNLEEISAGKIQSLFEFDSKTAEESAGIKKELKLLRTKRSVLQSEIAGIQKIEKTPAVSENDLKVLQSYFPNVNLAKIEDIQNFHKSISKIVNTECEEEENKIQKQLDEVVLKIEELENQLSPVLKDIPQSVLEEYAKTAVKISRLENSLENYKTKTEMKEQKENAEKEFRSTQVEVLASVSEKINNALNEFDEKTKTLRFEFPTQKSYRLYRENDVGTGTKNINLILFDLAVLSVTEVPFLIHDSYIFQTLEDDRVNFVLSLYEYFCKKHDRQIFIALDGQNHCNETSKEIIKNTTIIQLGKGSDALFGINK